ncbi:sodium/glutamate symporter [Oceanomicrobium pacificus]|uniref:Sodium/glutamate symporter n=1 Tax=Oceanomicrobium pacificus TaxID=2692916 RepID=A0A6B0TIS7_9RHOB|nr:sodium/glutamate symporter [Oceanomicrobium pacificus]MXU64277.1 sodium/glutamate symporter [Oceanomicrobium pacificus]
MTEWVVDDFMAMTLGIVVYFLGIWLNSRLAVLRRFTIPAPVSGGLLTALAMLGFYLVTGISVSFEMETRDLLLLYFFSAIGLNAKVSDLLAGGKALAILVGLTVTFIVAQNIVGITVMGVSGQPRELGVLVGSAALLGGHGTAIAWAPEVARLTGVPNAMEIGIAAATLGLVAASLIGGPIATFLIARNRLNGPDLDPITEEPTARGGTDRVISVDDFFRALLALHLAIIAGSFLNEALEYAGIRLPLFVSCLLCAILLSNTLGRWLPASGRAANSPALNLVSQYSLGLFLSMSLMAMQLWTIADLAGTMLMAIGAQVVMTAAFILLLVYPLMGRNYDAAVLSAGFGGFALGATPTAIANMTAVTEKHGPAPQAFLILPLVSAFFVDIANAIVLQAIL